MLMNAFWEAFMADEVVLCTPEVARKPCVVCVAGCGITLMGNSVGVACEGICPGNDELPPEVMCERAVGGMPGIATAMCMTFDAPMFPGHCRAC